MIKNIIVCVEMKCSEMLLMVIRINIESKQICAIKIIHLDQAPEDPEDVQKVFMWFVSMHSMAYTTCRNQIFSRLLIPSISPNTMIQSSRYIHHTITNISIYIYSHTENLELIQFTSFHLLLWMHTFELQLTLQNHI